MAPLQILADENIPAAEFQFAGLGEVRRFRGRALQAEDLGDKWVHSYGAGVRLVMASGFVFRLDGATGEEGFQSQLFLNYPWGLFN